MNNYEEMAKAFEVEELEERLEFRKWNVEANAGVKCNNLGCEPSVGVKVGTTFG